MNANKSVLISMEIMRCITWIWNFIAHDLLQTQACRYTLLFPSTMGMFVLYRLIRQWPVDLSEQSLVCFRNPVLIGCQ